MAYEDLKLKAEEIKNILKIEDIISSYISIKRAGKNYTALCPFHAEDTPSFYIFPETQTYHCFGCGAHGDAITFIKEYENKSFMDALKKCADMAGVNLDLKSHKKPKEIELNESLNKFYIDRLLNLPSYHKVWEFLKNRNINKDTAEEFEFGYSTGEEIEKVLEDTLIEKEIAVNSGLIKNDRDFFNGRLIIPIRDNNSSLVGFAGRLIENVNSPKYINSQENKYFKKSKILYMYHKTKSIIQKNDFAIITEGYFDAISMYKMGFKNIVAVLGSNLTKDHAFELFKSTNKIITMFDMDKAGEKATISSIDLLFEKGFQVAVANYDAKDPDELTKKHDKKYIAEILKKSYKFHEYIVDVKAKDYDLKNEFAVEEYLKEMAIWYKKIQQSNRFEIMEVFTEKISEKIDREKDFVKKVLIELSKNLKINNIKINESKQKTQITEKEIRYDLGKSFIYLWLKFPEYRKKIESVQEDILPENPLREFITSLKEGKELSQIIEDSSEELSQIISEIWKVDYIFEPERIYSKLMKSIDRINILKKIESLKDELKNTEEPYIRANITKDIIKLYSKLKKHGGNI